MQLLSLPNNTSVLAAPAGNRDLFHLYNSSAVTVYVCYDGDATATTVATLLANGVPVLPGTWVQLNNDGVKQIFNKPVYIAQNSGGAVTVNLQGV